MTDDTNAYLAADAEDIRKAQIAAADKALWTDDEVRRVLRLHGIRPQPAAMSLPAREAVASASSACRHA